MNNCKAKNLVLLISAGTKIYYNWVAIAVLEGIIVVIYVKSWNCRPTQRGEIHFI
jgi:hypothetical protein